MLKHWEVLINKTENDKYYVIPRMCRSVVETESKRFSALKRATLLENDPPLEFQFLPTICIIIVHRNKHEGTVETKKASVLKFQVL